jgi:hypothetical protein
MFEVFDFEAHKNPFTTWALDEGYRAVMHDSEDSQAIEVWLQCCSDGEVLDPAVRVWRADTRTLVDRGAQFRAYELWAAVARYLNAGGSVADALAVFRKIAGPDGFVEIRWPPDWHLLYTGQAVSDEVSSETGQPEIVARHVFGNLDTGQAFIMVEDHEVLHSTIDDIFGPGDEYPATGDDDDDITSLLYDPTL